MKKCFSRLITFINHLWRTLISTLVERWLSKHVLEVITLSSESGQIFEFILDDTGNSIVLEKENRNGNSKLNCDEECRD